MAVQTTQPLPVAARASARWVQLGLGLIAMMAISSPQYVWTLFTKPFQDSLGAALPAVQITFSIVIVLQTWLSPLQGYLVDSFGPRLLIALGCVLSGLGWVLSAWVTSLTGLYLTYGLFCGIGTGIVYVGIIGLMVRWFPDRRGLATGVVAAGYGFGAIATTFPIDSMLKSAGYQHTLVVFGIILGLVGAAAALAMRTPNGGDILPPAPAMSHARDVAPRQMLGTPVFWLLFAMMTMMSTGGLMIISQFAAFSRDFGVANVVVFGLAALPLALTVDRITNGLTRPFFGWLSDRIGRENTMAVAFLMEAAAVAIMVLFRNDALVFVVLSAVVFFGWGEIFSLFPSLVADYFGAQCSTANYGVMYSAKGVAAIIGGGVAALLYERFGTWTACFYGSAALAFMAAVIAFGLRFSGSARTIPIGVPAAVK